MLYEAKSTSSLFPFFHRVWGRYSSSSGWEAGSDGDAAEMRREEGACLSMATPVD